MQIEPIDLRLPSKVPRWLWYLNGVLFLVLVALVSWPQVWRGDEPVDDAFNVPKPVAASAPASVASQARVIDASPPALDWDAVLTGLEKNQTEGVAMEGFTIDAVSRTMRLTLSFDTYTHLAEYIGSPHLKSTKLQCQLDSAEMLTEPGPTGLLGKAVVNCE